ncbi:Glutathione S-transferase [Harpegnathos saltator]|uniref:glutathione transferase n=1 Tax=Harpegnathos saltator TaxID=610380 RepID=E2C1U9_HARSA|nr:Glutathione S-transferase [Harpegnathos saltator]
MLFRRLSEASRDLAVAFDCDLHFDAFACYASAISNMPTYKLTYFNITGLAEPIRYMFHYAGIKFEDARLESQDWSKCKTDMPLGQVPVLEIDGKKYHQSKAIGRYVAKKCNLYSSDEIEALEIDATVDSLDDMRQAMSVYHHEKDPAVKEKMKKTTFEKLSFFLDKLEEQVKKNGGHFVRGKLTWPDVIYAAYVRRISEFTQKEITKDHPELKKLVDKVDAIPSIKAYLDKRPKTEF